MKVAAKVLNKWHKLYSLTPFNSINSLNSSIICTFAAVLCNKNERYCIGRWKRDTPLPNY